METRTADMRELPLDDATMDVAVSSIAIHNIYQVEGRGRAIAEIARVLKPGGQVMIDDIRHLPRYVAWLREAGFDVNLTGGVRSWFWRVVSFGNLVPGTLVGRKALPTP